MSRPWRCTRRTHRLGALCWAPGRIRDYFLPDGGTMSGTLVTAKPFRE